MGDRLQAGKLSWYVTSHPGQLSLAIPLWVGEISTSLGWEGNCRSGVALAMRHKQVVYLPTDSTAYERDMSTLPTLLRSMALLYIFSPHNWSKNRDQYIALVSISAGPSRVANISTVLYKL